MTTPMPAAAPPPSLTPTTKHTARHRGANKRRAKLAVFVLAVVTIIIVRPAAHHARAASLLVSFSDPANTPEVAEQPFPFERSGEQIPGRLYLPRGVENPPGVVLVHGVHRDGIDEVRLQRFARALAGAGVAVMTPAVKELSDYKVAPR